MPLRATSLSGLGARAVARGHSAWDCSGPELFLILILILFYFFIVHWSELYAGLYIPGYDLLGALAPPPHL